MRGRPGGEVKGPGQAEGADLEQTLHKKWSGSCIFPAGGSIERRLGRSRAPPVPPSTHLLCPHLAPHVDDAGLPAAVAQQVLPQVAAGLIKALQWGESSVTSTETTNPPHKGGHRCLHKLRAEVAGSREPL